MARKPDWTPDEFETLLANPESSNEELAKKLPQRSVGAVDAVRSGSTPGGTRQCSRR